MKLIVGLGNPGRQYVGTRHNVGFDVLAEILARHGGGAVSAKFQAEVAEVVIGSEKVLLVAPQTYMNLSGRSVAQFVAFYKLPAADLLVICDDMNLPLGRLRLRASGSAGGQKGLADIIGRLGTNEVPRLRFGVGRPPQNLDGASYVLAKFRSEERDTVAEGVHAAADAAEKWVRDGIDRAMSDVNASNSASSGE